MIKTIIDFRSNQPPLKYNYLGNFMLTNMLGHIWLDGRECPWTKTDVKIHLHSTDSSGTAGVNDLETITEQDGQKVEF